MSRRLRARMLLLLVPLLMASAPSTPPPASNLTALPGQPDHLAFVGLPPELLLGRCTQFGVELRDVNEAPVPAPTQIPIALTGTLMGGSFYDRPGCGSSPVDSVEFPVGASSRQVWYLTPLLGTVMLTASDGPSGLGDVSSKLLNIIVELPATHFEVTPDSTNATAGVPVTFMVTAKNATGTATQYAGTVHFSTSASGVTLPPDYTFNPAVDNGLRKFFVTFNKAGTADVTVQDANSQVQPSTTVYSVEPGPSTRLQVDLLTTPVRAGQPVPFKVTALDESGNITSRQARLRFTTDVPSAELPTDTPDTDSVSLPQQFTATFRTASPDLKKLTVTDVSTVPNITQTVYLVVLPGPPASVEVTALPSTTVPACGMVALNLAAFDLVGNATSEPGVVRVCKDSSRAATVVENTLTAVPTAPVPPPYCVTGELKGTAKVVWTDQVEEGVDFTVSGIGEDKVLKVTWAGSGISPVNSSLQFVESSALLPELATYQGKLTLKLTLVDFCGRPAQLPSNQTLSFAADTPLEVSNPPRQDPELKNVWTSSVRLSACPADPSLPLAIGLLVNNAPPKAGRVERRVQPKCVMPVALKLLSPADSLSVEPGAMAEFELEVSSSADEPITGGVLRVSGEGLNVIGATLEDKALTRNGDGTGFELPELRKDAPLTLKVQVQATTRLDGSALAKARVLLNDSQLSDEMPVNFTAEKLGVDVGCGCHSAAPASQLLPWLLLLLAGSRPWGGLRRLRRGERTDD